MINLIGIAALAMIVNFFPIEAKDKIVKHLPHHTTVKKIIRVDRLNKWISLGLMRITSYTGGDPRQGTGLRTATGTRPRYGIVAVDKRVIPLGTILYIPGFGRVRAEDTGGAIRGAHIDLCFGVGEYAKHLASVWGTQMRTVYLVKKKASHS